MNQLFNVSISSVDVTDKVSGCIVSESMNRFYDVCTFQIEDDEPILIESDLVVNYGGKTFAGFVYKLKKIDNNILSVEARTYSAKLTEPYSPAQRVLDNATTSAELCTLYSTVSGVTITNSSAVLDFGGSYERNGTMLSALTNIANVTGSEFYVDSNGGVVIEPNKAITGTGMIIPPEDIFDFMPYSKTVFNSGVGYITIQNGGSESTDIVSTNKVYAEIDECSGEIYVFPNPYGELELTKGVSPLVETTIDRKEERSVLDQDIIYLDGAILSVSAVTLNGAAIATYNYEVGHNVMYFNTTQRGTISVTYTASAYKGYTNISVTELGRFISLDLYYLDQALLFQGFLSPDCLNANTDGDMTCIIPREMMYPKGFTVWTIGGVPEFTFFGNNLEINVTEARTNTNYISVEDARLEETVTGYIYRPRYDITTALGARSAGVNVSYTTDSDEDGDYFEFTTYYPNLVVSYEVAATSHYVQFADIPGVSVAMVIRNDNTGETCEYDLEGINADDLSSIPCVLDQYVPINVANELGVEVIEVYNVVVPYTKPTLATDTVIVDEFGIAKIWVFIDGDYILDTSDIKSRTSITFTSNVGG